jgi:hypothetical protein
MLEQQLAHLLLLLTVFACTFYVISSTPCFLKFVIKVVNCLVEERWETFL